MVSLLKYTKKYRKEVILGPIFKFLEAVFELLLPMYMARLIDNGIAKNDPDYVIKTAVTMIIMSVVGLICVMICQYYASIASQGFGTELRNQLMKKINGLSHKELNDFGTATLITRMTSDINQLQLALAMLIRLVIRAPFLSIGSVVMAFYINPKMALIFVFSLPVFCLILFFMMKKTVPLYKKVQEKLDHLNQVVQENLSGVRVIRAFAQKDKERHKMADTSDDLAKAYTRVANISALLNPATTFIMNVSIVALLYFGGINVNTGAMGQGEVLALINYLIQMLLALIVVSNLVVIFTRASASAGRVNEVFHTDVSIHDQGQLALVPDSLNQLNFQDVSFRYSDKSGLALENVSFSLEKGEMLGIIGPTGSGKSTLTQLIPRFYDASAGSVNVLGHDVKDYGLDDLRNKIGVVPQTSVLFTGTIRENLQWGKPDATDEDCWQALRTSQSYEFVKDLKEQLDTPVMESGKNFSGGQRQRLTIARALIKKPAFLILDDSLSALDYQTDLELRQALQRDLADTSLIIVSQRVSSVQHAAKILVLEDGNQVGLGTHNHLMTHSEVYQEIVASQQEKEET
ncbi:ABC transporter ATP-binding protein [uncultured Vagococcus sp.]|uniref:ABC transporter ATP-binding protein n=1 Tax=uncultured Vagococcus sp. TaxID=189676 RepID=UPI0028D02EE5|nr:ABC transporter ATP-binding protein [uncultured Vagococcus sp.]